jgi:hypothetical protein
MPPRLAEAQAAVIAGTASCSTCGRTPLVGEWASLFDRRGSEVWVCELCRESGAPDGVPLGRRRLRSAAVSNVRRVV